MCDNINWTESDISLTTLQNRSLLASSSGASTSSNKQNGAGLILNIEKTKAIPVPAFSPPDNRFRFFTSFPGGFAIIFTPVLSKSLSVSSRKALPPPNILGKNIQDCC